MFGPSLRESKGKASGHDDQTMDAPTPVGRLYLILNKVTGKCYVGQTRGTLSHRWSQHRCDAARDSPCLIHRSIRKHGLDNFDFQQLCTCPLEDLDDMEAMFIEMYDSLVPAGYNVLPGSRSNLRTTAARRVRKEDTDLPLYVTHYFDFQRGIEGVRVRHTPTGQSVTISSKYLTMEQKLQQALQFLKEAEAGRVATRPPKVHKPRDLPPYVCFQRRAGRKDSWKYERRHHKTVCFGTYEEAIKYARNRPM